LWKAYLFAVGGFLRWGKIPDDMDTLSIHITARVDDDGVLEVKIPTTLPAGEVEVFLTARAVRTRPASCWPADFFETTCGRWEGDFERPAPGDYEVRPSLDASDEVSS
jgi:hypothetical protein